MLDLHKQRTASQSDFERGHIEAMIANTDRQINRLVYELYGLTEDEIAIVEGP